MKISLSYSMKYLLSASLMMGVFNAPAALIVVGDLGGQPTAPLFEAINANNETTASVRTIQPETPATLSISDMLPVSTPEMTPGQVADRPLHLPGMPPVFIVGNDPSSRQWLEAWALRLKEIGATGMVVNVKDEASLHSLRQLTPGVSLVPVRGGDLARRLQLSHYPVLITASGLQQ